jgi:hypothetical protein
MFSRGYFLPAFLLMIILYSCNPTKYVPANETILEKNEININKQQVSKSDLTPYIKQQPNKRIFGSRFYLGLYNLSDTSKTRWPHKWLQEIGEPPVIFDPDEARQTTDQIKTYVASKGYFDGKVKDSIKTEDRETTVFYNVDLLPAYTIRNINFEITDPNIRTLFNFDSVNCLIKRGKAYDEDILAAERTRFERFIRDRGFYAFSSEYISFQIDSTVGNRQVNIYYNIGSQTVTDNFNRISYVPHSIYDVKDIYIYPDYDPASALEKGDAYLNELDTIFYRGYYFITPNETPEIRYDLILQALYLKPSTAYGLTNEEQTKSHLMSLKVYRLVNITYHETGEPVDSSTNRQLNSNIMLTLLTPQSYRIELEGTNSSGNLGGALNLIYQHKNLFHGAEMFSVKLKGAYEALKDTSRLRSTKELGFETNLRIPKFLIPFIKKEDFIKKYNPSTNILAAYNYQAMPLFTRTLATATFGYTWRAGNYQSHIVNPLLLNLIKLPPGSLDSAFAANIKLSFQEYSYRDVMIFGGGYSFIYNNQKIQKSSDYWFLRINFETAGNMIALTEKLSGAKRTDGFYRFLGQAYAQYVRTDFDVRYNYIFNTDRSIVYRGFVGIGIPYGNSKAIPFEKQYFGGGANSIRAWQVRSLGPGSYDPPEASFLNQTADIKLEFNAEYRYKLFWILDGALFLDAGNIWTYNNDPARPGTQFSLKKFYKDFAIGTGTGFRFDFQFVIARVDIGMKLRDPRAGEGWILGSRPYTRKDFALVLGIGYPF